MKWLNKLYEPNPNGRIEVSNEPYGFTWLGINDLAPSKNVLYNLIENLGYVAGNVTIVDDVKGDDSSGKAGNILRPFKTHQAAIGSMYAITNGVCITMPGNYNIGTFGLPLKNGIDHYFINANFTSTGFSYGLIMVYPSYVKCKLYGKAVFTDASANNSWAQITPYCACDIEFEGISFTGNKQVIGSQGATGGYKFLKFKNCNLTANDNVIPIYQGAWNYNAFSDTFSTFEDCYIKGTMLVSTGNNYTIQNEYILRYERCQFESIDTNINGLKASLVLLDYYGNSDVCKILLDHCRFKGNHENIYTNLGYGSIGTNKYLIGYDNKFMNGNTEGWIKNDNQNFNFKLDNNLITFDSIGTYPVANLLTGTGIRIENNLEF